MPIHRKEIEPRENVPDDGDANVCACAPLLPSFRSVKVFLVFAWTLLPVPWIGCLHIFRSWQLQGYRQSCCQV